jgi:hypothetical protein
MQNATAWCAYQPGMMFYLFNYGKIRVTILHFLTAAVLA